MRTEEPALLSRSKFTLARLTLTLAAAAALVMLAETPMAAAKNKPFYGVANQSGLATLGPQDFDRMRNGRVGTLRFLVNVDQVRRDGRLNWGSIDNALRSAAARGIRGMPYIYQAKGPRTKRQRRAFARFAGQMAARYGPGSEFWQARAPDARRPILAWQILSEQNSRHQWSGRPRPRLYGRALKAASRAIRRHHKRAEIVLGGMWGFPRGKGSMPSWRYLNRLYRVKRIKRAFNTVGVNPYAPNLKGIRLQMRRVRGVMRRNGHRRGKIRVTEIGWGSARRGHRLHKGPKGQARLINRSFRLLTRHRNRRKGWNVRGIALWNWRDWHPGGSTRICNWCPTSGLFTSDNRPKRSWGAYKRATRR
jgi:hypothetical protein